MKKVLFGIIFCVNYLGFSQSPGNISGDLSLWLKADTGTNTTTNGTGITTWADQSGNGFDAIGTGTAVYDSSNLLNYNPVITFSGGPDDTVLNPQPITGTITRTNGLGSTIFVVSDIENSTERDALIEFNDDSSTSFNDRQIFFTDVYFDGVNHNLNKGIPKIYTIQDTDGDSSVDTYENNNLINSGNLNTANNTQWTSANYYIGDDETGGDELTGRISEIIFYDAVLNSTDKQKIETYLAIKYGLTLDNSTGGINGNYVLSDGTTTIWDALANTIYHNDVIAIGKDDNSALEQIKSTDSSGFLTLEKTSSFTTDLDFVIVGHDNNSIELSDTNIPTGIINRSQRVWKAQTNGTPGTMSVSFELGTDIINTGIVSDYELLTDTDTDFSDATINTVIKTIVGNTLTFSNVTLSNNQFFTLGIASLTYSPGSVSSGIVSWFKADKGTDTTVDGTVITQWDNNNGSTHATQAGSTDYPTYEENIHNFNSSIHFENGDDGYFDVDLDEINDSDYNIIAIVERDANVSDNYMLGTGSTNNNEGLHFGYRDNGILTFAQRGNDINSSVNNFDDPAVSKSLIRGQLNSNIGKTIQELRDGTFVENTDVSTAFLKGDHPGRIGKGHSSSSGFKGYVSEVIIYSSTLSDADLTKIYSYLAIKYGMTLDIADGVTNGNYQDSDTDVIWDATTNAIYHNEVIGVGRDEKSEFEQLKSIEPSRVSTALTVEKTSSFSNDQNFILIGNDGGTIGTTTTEIHPDYVNRVERTWKVQVTGTPGVVDVSLTIGGGITNTGNVYDYALLIDNDTDFSDATIHNSGITLVGNILTFKDVAFSDGDIFTLAVESISTGPGDVIGNLALWLKANEGTNTTTDGSALTTWLDQSGDTNDASGTGDALYKEDAFNFNPSIEFFNTDVPINGNMTRDKGVESTIFIVQKHTTTEIDAFGDFYGSGSNRQYFFNERYAGSSNVFDLNVGQVSILSVMDPGSTDDSTIYENGSILATNSKSTNSSWSSLGSYRIGDDQTGGNELTGEIAEVLYYDRELSTTERQKVESYLAVKYGITLDNSTGDEAGDYLISDNTIVWDASVNTIYHNDIFGIGRDDDSVLNQLKSRSENSDGFITIEKTSSFPNDKDFILLGNDSNGIFPTDTNPHPSYSDRVDRVWNVKINGTPGNVTINFHLDDLSVYNSEDVTDYALLIDGGDNDFSSGATTHTTGATISNGVLTFTNVSLSNNDYISLAIKDPVVPFPGGISTDITLWLKASDKTNTTTDGVGVTSWVDKSGNGANATGTGDAVYDNSEFINYNPSISFTGDDQPISGDITRVKGLGSTVFVVSEVEDVTERQNMIEFADEPYTGNNNRQIFFTDTYYNGVNHDITKGIPEIYTVEDTDGTSSVNIFENNNLINTGNLIGSHNTQWTTAKYYLGDDATGGDELTGKIAEVIYYDDVLSTIDKQKVETYLAVKYGMTLDNASSGTDGDYVLSDGSIIWDADTNVDYRKNIIAIGQDEDSGLYQKQSKAENSNAVLAISLGSSIETSNNDNENTFTDNKDFLVIGSKSTSDIFTLECEGSEIKVNRDWFVQNTNFDQTVTLQFDMTGISAPTNLNLLLDTDGDFTNTSNQTTNTSGSYSSPYLTFTGVTLTDGVAFTLIRSSDYQVKYNGITWIGGSGTDGIPTIEDTDKIVILESSYEITESFNCGCLNIKSDQVLTVPTTLFVETEELILNGDLYLVGDAELIQNSVANLNTGTGNVHKIINGLTESGYRFDYVTSPVNTLGTYNISDNMKISNDVTDLSDNTDISFISTDSDGFGTTLSSSWFYTLNHLTDYTKIDEDTALNPGVGFTMKGSNQTNSYNFIGNPNNGNITALSIADGDFAIVGNPYPSGINIGTFNTDMLTENITTGIVYLWDQPKGDSHLQDQYDGGYATINSLGVGAPASGVSGASTPVSTIKPGQGFVIEGGTVGGDVVFTNSMRPDNTSTSGTKFFKTTKASLLNSTVRLGFEFESEKGTYHRQLVISPGEGTLDYEEGLDAKMFDNKANDAYLLIENDDTKYVINNIPSEVEDLELPLGVVLSKEEEISFKLDGTESFNSDIYLLDKDLDIVTDIRKNEYKVTVASGNDTDRFSLVFKGDGTLGNDHDLSNKTIIYTEKENLHVVLDSGIIENVKIYDLSGKEYIDYNADTKSSSITIDVDGIIGDIVVIKVITDKDVFIQKVFIGL